MNQKELIMNIEESTKYVPDYLANDVLNKFDANNLNNVSNTTLSVIWDDLDAMDADLN